MSTTHARTPQTFSMYQVCWKSVVGEGVGRDRPVPRNVAEFLVRDEALANPLRRYWVERYQPEPRRDA
jgi:hypothetical protein